MSEQLTRGEVQDLLTKFSKKTPNYRAALLKNPKAVLEGQMNAKLPANVTVKAVEETPTTMYVVVPYVGKTGGELSDGALEMVAGGGDGGKGSSGSGDTYSCNQATGGQNTRVEFNASVSLV
jgi:hypothetical protein